MSPALCPGTEGEGRGTWPAQGHWSQPELGESIRGQNPSRVPHSQAVPQPTELELPGPVCLKTINYKHPAPCSHVLTPPAHAAPGAHTAQMETLQSTFFSLEAETATSSFFFSSLPFASKTHRYICGRANIINNVPWVTLLRDTDSKSQEFPGNNLLSYQILQKNP